MANSFTTIRTTSAQGIFTITLQRPEVLNAFNAQMSIELSAALRQAQRDPQVRCLVLTGAGRAFCAGQDLRPLRPTTEGSPTLSDDLGAYLRETVNPVALRLRTCEKPVIAAVNGVAAGAGVSFALAADLRICARSASFKLAFGDIGLVPDAGATLTLVQHLGYARAAELCLLGEELSAQRAWEIGLVQRVVDDAELPALIEQVAGRVAARSTPALMLTKRALQHAWTATLEEQLEYEAFLQTTAGRTTEHRQAIAAFFERRSADSGKP